MTVSECPDMGGLVCDPQSTNTAGFIFGMTLAVLLILQMFILGFTKGTKGNDEFKYFPGTQFPRCLLAFRLIAVVFALTALAYTFKHDGGASPVWALAYFTIWNWLVVCMYFVVSLQVSILRVFFPHMVPSISKFGSTGPPAGARSAVVKILMTSQQILGEIEVSCSVLVFLIVWAYLAPTEGFASFLTFTSVAQHIFNAILMVTDFFFAGYRMNGTHFVIPLGFGGMYVFWHLLGNSAYGLMAYPFMATDNAIFIAWAIGLAIILVVFYFIFYGLSVLKTKHRNKRLGELNEESQLGAPGTTKKVESATPEQEAVTIV